MNIKYELNILPGFYKDMDEILDYYLDVLHNKPAAEKLLSAVEDAIIKRLGNAESFEPYRSRKIRSEQYYRIYVRNYIVFYVVIDNGNFHKTMEVRRILYKKRNYRIEI